MKIIAEFSDYTIQSIEYFISAIESAVALRDISGLSAGRVSNINITKEHPLVVLMGSAINPNVNLDVLRTSILPAIAVTPGNMSEEGVALGQAPQSFVVDDDWILEFQNMKKLSLKEIQSGIGLITPDQVNTITAEYRKNTGIMRCQKNTWGWNEEINVSCWSDNPDMDILFGTLLDSIFAKMRVGFMGDESPMKNLKYRITKGLTNFNFGRVLFGTEYSLTFFNTYHNYTVYTEEHATGHDLLGGFKVTGSDDIWQMPTE